MNACMGTKSWLLELLRSPVYFSGLWVAMGMCEVLRLFIILHMLV